ncbi:MAG TPA: hypothetical protein VE667_01595 [Xanthobacteraceae bacterium]|nr:hypothetical protein [Xanthobacteraceae bacterium]
MSAAHDLHPDFGLLCPTKRLRRKMRVAVGCVLLALVAGAVLQASLSPPRTLTSALVEREPVTDSGQAPAAMIVVPSSREAAEPAVGNPDCERDGSAHRTWAYFEGRCGVNRGRKRLRAATEHPPLAGIALGRTAPAPQSVPALAPIAPIPPIIAAERPAEPSTSAATMPPQTEGATEPSHRRSVVASKRPQKTVRRENRRRDVARRDVPWWREVRAADWGARAYGGGGGDYARGGYVREGFFGDMR